MCRVSRFRNRAQIIVSLTLDLVDVLPQNVVVKPAVIERFYVGHVIRAHSAVVVGDKYMER